MKKTEDITSNDIRFSELFSKEVAFKEDEFTNKEKVWQDILTQIAISQKRSLKWIWMVAASVTLAIITTTLYFITDKELVSGESMMAFSLPDGSRVEMQKDSRLSYNQIAWLWNRSVDFSGDAYFTVAKGERFTINTGHGSVAVLGTEFQIQTMAETLAVECFSGSVCVKTEIGEKILQQGEKVNCSRSEIIFTPVAEVLPDFLKYNNVPLSDVVNRIEMLYSVTITPADIYSGIIYDGLLPTSNLNEALEMVFSSCGITYTISGNQIHISSYAD